MDARYTADTKIANSNREFQMQKADFDQEVNAKKAEAELAYQLQVRIVIEDPLSRSYSSLCPNTCFSVRSIPVLFVVCF